MTTTANEKTGLKNADELIATAARAGLKVTVEQTDKPGDGPLPGYTSVTVTVGMHCPSTYAGTMLGVEIQLERLIASFRLSHEKGSRSKLMGAKQKSWEMLGGGRKVRTLRYLNQAAEDMGAKQARHFERAEEDLPTESAPVTLVAHYGDGADYKSTCGTWEVAAIFKRRKRGDARKPLEHYTVRHIASDTEIEGKYKSIGDVRLAFACGEITAPGSAVCRDSDGVLFMSHAFTPNGLDVNCRRCAAPRRAQYAIRPHDAGTPTPDSLTR